MVADRNGLSGLPRRTPGRTKDIADTIIALLRNGFITRNRSARRRADTGSTVMERGPGLTQVGQALSGAAEEVGGLPVVDVLELDRLPGPRRVHHPAATEVHRDMEDRARVVVVLGPEDQVAGPELVRRDVLDLLVLRDAVVRQLHPGLLPGTHRQPG